MAEVEVVLPDDIVKLKEKRAIKKSINERKRDMLISEIQKWDVEKDNFKFKFFFALIVNLYYTDDLLNVINRDYHQLSRENNN